jgi:hypothetical protein
MRYVKWTLLILIVLFVGLFLQYNLPRHDIVRITGTDMQRINVGWNGLFYANRMRDAQGNLIGTDVRLINTVRANGKTKVYRNEDTDFWPPYLKFDSADLQTKAQDFVSTAENPRWVAMRFYGWRNRFFTIYPNATSVWLVSGPDATIIPWFNIIFFILLAALILWIWRVWRNFRESRIDPLIDEIEDSALDARARSRGWWRRITGR